MAGWDPEGEEKGQFEVRVFEFKSKSTQNQYGRSWWVDTR